MPTSESGYYDSALNYGANVGNALLAFYGQERTNDANAQQARLNRKFQERMSNTAHFREMIDLRRAGLNPILSATGGSGASTPAGAQAVMGNSIGAGLESYQAAASGTSSRNLQKAQVSSTDAQTNLTKETTVNQPVVRAQMQSQIEANQATAANQSAQAELVDTQKNRLQQQMQLDTPKSDNSKAGTVPYYLKRGRDIFDTLNPFRSMGGSDKGSSFNLGF